MDGACLTRVSKRATSATFERRIRWHSISKHRLPRRLWKCLVMIFIVVWHKYAKPQWLGSCRTFLLLPLFFLFSCQNINVSFVFVFLFNLVLILLIVICLFYCFFSSILSLIIWFYFIFISNLILIIFIVFFYHFLIEFLFFKFVHQHLIYRNWFSWFFFFHFPFHDVILPT